MTTLADLTAIHVSKLGDGLWHICIQAGSKIVCRESANTLQGAMFAAGQALERFRDDTQPGEEYYGEHEEG